VRDDVEGKLDISFDDLGEKRLKNIARPVHLYRVRVGGLARRPMPPVPEKPSIAVLPFHTPGGDSDQDTFADGMLEEIVTALARTKWLFVISVNSSASYKGRRNIDDREVGRELGVRYVLEGSVRKSANRVRVAAQLVDAIGGHHVWAERYESVQAEIFAMQDEITDRVVAAIEPRLYAAEGIRARRKPPESLDAWESVVRSISLINARTKPDADMARQLLQTAIELDPGYAQAHSLMAFVLAFGVHSGWYPREDALAAAHDNARRALRLDPLEPWAHAACGFAFVLSRRIAEGVLEYERAIDLNPSFAQGYTMLSAALCYLGRGQDAMARLDTAERLSPLDLLTHGNLGSINVMRAAACMVDNRFQEGSVFARRAIVENPSSTPAARELVINLALAGELDEAKSALNIVKRLQPDITLKWIEDWSPFVRDEDTLKYIDGFRLVGLE
jgi:TolB-like protein/Tfp pilus assembly protein PilF